MLFIYTNVRGVYVCECMCVCSYVGERKKEDIRIRLLTVVLENIWRSLSRIKIPQSLQYRSHIYIHNKTAIAYI